MLLGNYTVLNRNPLRYLGGSTASPEVNFQPNFNRGGAKKNRQYVNMTTAANKQFSLPYGSYTFFAYQMPQKGGNLSARSSDGITIAPTATGGLGMPGDGTATLSIFTNTPDGQLIVSGTGTATLLLDANNPLLTASINATGSTSFLIDTNVPVLGAEASLTGTTTITISSNAPVVFPIDDSPVLRTATASFAFDGTLTRYAVGHMIGSTVDNSVLTADSITAAVWNAILADFNENGTAGKALASAGSGGVDLEALAQAILAAAQVTPIHADSRMNNGSGIIGDGSIANPWRGVGVQP